MSLWTDVRAALALINRRDRRMLGVAVLLQSLLSLLDLIAVALIGLVALVAAGAATGTLPTTATTALERLGLSTDDPSVVAIWMAVLAGFLLVTKSVLSFVVTRRVMTFLANRQAMVSSDLAARLLSQPLLTVQQRSSQQVSFALISGVNAVTLGILGQSVIIVTEVSLLAVLAVGLLFFDPVVTVFTVLFFTVVALALHRVISGWAARLGRRGAVNEIESYEAVQEVLRTYREVTVMGRRPMFVERFGGLRWQAAKVQADLVVMGSISKYVFEVSLIVGGAILVASQLFTRDLPSAVAVIAVFLAAASRVMPSLLRLQGAATQVRRDSGTARPTFELAEQLRSGVDPAANGQTVGDELRERVREGMRDGFPGFHAEVILSGVSLTYPGATEPAAEQVSLTIPVASSLGLVGSTGAGKSTVADLVLGVLAPDSGTVTLSGVAPADAVARWPGAIAYVPQETAVMNADVRSNVALGLPEELIDDDRVWDALEKAHLADFLRDEREGIRTVVGEHGVRLSGGQRQRLGLARALYTGPRLLVLDEATSALDAETESLISTSIAALSGDVTLIIIAHRLVTIRDCTQVAYIEAGRLAALGTFDEVRFTAPALDRQARLLGL